MKKQLLFIVDVQSVKNSDTAKDKGYDGGKKISGIKRHIAVDIEGLPHAISVSTANVTDRSVYYQCLMTIKKFYQML